MGYEFRRRGPRRWNLRPIRMSVSAFKTGGRHWKIHTILVVTTSSRADILILSRIAESTRIRPLTASLVHTPPLASKTRSHSSRSPATNFSAFGELYRSKMVLVVVMLVLWMEAIFRFSRRRAIVSSLSADGSVLDWTTNSSKSH